MAKELITPIDYDTGQPLWWENLINAYSEEGYKTRIYNFLFTFKENSYATITSDNRYWYYIEFTQNIKNLSHNDSSIKECAQKYISSYIEYVLSNINGIIKDNTQIEIDGTKKNIKVNFLALLDDNKLKRLSFTFNYEH